MTPRQAGIALPTLPKDLTDLQLARLVLIVDRRLDELDLLDLRELLLGVALQAPAPDRSLASRRQALLMMVCHQLDLPRLRRCPGTTAGFASCTTIIT